MTPGAGTSPGAGSLSPSQEAADVFSSASATKETDGIGSSEAGGEGGGGGAGPDVAYAEASKPFSGGPVAPGPDPTEDGKYYRAARGSAYRCKENVPTAAAGIDKLTTHVKLDARFIKVLVANPSIEGPGVAVTCSKYYVRMTEGTGAAAKCTYFALAPDCRFGGNVLIQDASAIRFQYYKYPADEEPNEPCGLFPRETPDSALLMITNEVDFSDLDDPTEPPLCGSPRRAGG